MPTESERSEEILIISGYSMRREALASAVWQGGWEPRMSTTAAEAVKLLGERNYAAVLCDDVLPDDDFRAVIAGVQRRVPGVPVIVVSRRDEWEPYIMALAAGATDYVAFPPYEGEVEQALANAIRLCRSCPNAA